MAVEGDQMAGVACPAVSVADAVVVEGYVLLAEVTFGSSPQVTVENCPWTAT